MSEIAPRESRKMMLFGLLMCACGLIIAILAVRSSLNDFAVFGVILLGLIVAVSGAVVLRTANK